MPSLRERKKADTRDAIRASAVDLFCDRGFDQTTMDAIAEAADVSVRTVFRYFPSKEDLVFAESEADLADLRLLLDQRPADEPLLVSVRAVAELLVERMEPSQDEDARLAPLLHDVPALRARYLQLMDRVEGTVAGWARDRLEAGPDDLRPRLLAASMVAVQRVVVDAITAGDPRPIADLVRQSMDLLGHGFDGLEP